jgi:hypothetical protein
MICLELFFLLFPPSTWVDPKYRGIFGENNEWENRNLNTNWFRLETSL